MKVPKFIYESNVNLSPLKYCWDGQHSPWLSDGSQTKANKALSQLSVRSSFAFIAVAGEWLNFRLFGDAGHLEMTELIKAFWVGIENPGALKVESLHLRNVEEKNPQVGPLIEYLKLLRWIWGLALKVTPSFSGYVESELKLVEYIISDKKFTDWRLRTLADLSKRNTEPSILEAYKILRVKGLHSLEVCKVWGDVITRSDLTGGENYILTDLLKAKNPYVELNSSPFMILNPVRNVK